MGDTPPPAIPPPPPGDATGGARRLVRDPTARLGGVASGLAHYYGIDVSLVRIGFIVFTLFTGVGLLAYLLAWIIVPRSDYWPPLHGPASGLPSQPMSNRDLTVALVVLLGLAALLVQGGWGTSWVLPVLLVFAGVWLLNQQDGTDNRAPGSAPYPAPGSAPFPTPDPRLQDTVSAREQGTPAGPETAQWAAAPGPAPYPYPSPYPGPEATAQQAAPVGPPAGPAPVLVPPRRRRGLIAVLIGLFLFFIVLPIASVITVIALFASGQIDIGAETRQLTPPTVDEIPASVDLDAGEVVVDLREIDPDEFDADNPVELDISLGFGSATVYLPEGINADISANAGAGDLDLLGQRYDGINQSADIDQADEQIELDINVGFGEVQVVQG
jgi:phage shock protein PspC (stress-responsive transcriptional regulator)